MNVLIDTNILIPLEDTARELPPKFAEFKRLCTGLSYRLLIHPAQKADIKRDKNEVRREIVLSRINQYEEIQSPPNLSAAELGLYGWSQQNDNDRVDNLLLHSLCRGAIHFLITDDIGIHKKAKVTAYQETVFRFDQFLTHLKEKVKPQATIPFGLEHRYLHEFDVSQVFFDSLRSGYPGFNEWYLNSARKQRKAWCVTNGNEGNTLLAICIYKEEENETIVDGGLPLNGRVLKLCTLKVSEEVRGRKLGERLLYSAFKYAHEGRCKWVYLHTFGEEHRLLVSLCEEYGFKFAGNYGKDEVYLKEMQPRIENDEMPALEYSKIYFPHYRSGENVQKFLVPIKPGYHNQLFADISDITNTFFANDPSMYAAPANTIKKAYLCHASTRKIKSGDILLFYRTQDRMSIEAIGIVEIAIHTTDLNEANSLVTKRTVYKDTEVERLLEKKTLIILFRLQKYIEPIRKHELENAGLIGPYQSIRQIDNDKFNEVFSDR